MYNDSSLSLSLALCLPPTRPSESFFPVRTADTKPLSEEDSHQKPFEMPPSKAGTSCQPKTLQPLISPDCLRSSIASRSRICTCSSWSKSFTSSPKGFLKCLGV